MNKRNLRAVQASYDRIAAHYAQCTYSESSEEWVDRPLLDLLAARVQGVIGDLGCGPGHHVRYLHEKGLVVVGVDLSQGMVAQARQRNPGLEFIQASMYQLPVANESWGGIVAIHSLIHIPRPEVVQVLREFRRVLMSGGWLLVGFHRGKTTWQAQRWGNVPIAMSYTHFRTPEMQGYLQKAGFLLEGLLELGSPSQQSFLFARKPLPAPEPAPIKKAGAPRRPL